jgi:hypothetical protein
MASFYPHSKRNLHKVGNGTGWIPELVTSDYLAEFAAAL